MIIKAYAVWNIDGRTIVYGNGRPAIYKNPAQAKCFVTRCKHIKLKIIELEGNTNDN